MRPRRTYTAALILGGLMLAGPAAAQNASRPAQAQPAQTQTAPAQTQTAAQNAPQAPDANDEFILGRRRIGVIAGQVVECADEKDRPNKITDAMSLADQIAIHFGLKAAFNYVGAVGYGAGKPFDKANCQQSIANWSEIQSKYANK
jgi:hypothetical protein